jgi:membrane protein DedA with SNARE-associated domain
MESFLSQAGYAAIFLFGLLEACCVPIPSEITFGFGGVLAYQGHLNIVGVIIVGVVAELIGSMISFTVGRVGGRPLVHRFGRYVLLTQSDIDRAERFFAGRGAWAVPVGRALPVVRSFVSIVAGFIEIPPMLFAFLSLIGTAVWVTAIALIGYGVGSAWHSVAHGIAVAGYAIAVVVVVAIVGFVVYRLREVRRERAAGAGQHAGGTAQPPAGVRPGGPGRHAQGTGAVRGPDQGESRRPSPRSPMP